MTDQNTQTVTEPKWADINGDAIVKGSIYETEDGRRFYARGLNTRAKDRCPMVNIGLKPYPEVDTDEPLDDQPLSLNGRPVKTINVPATSLTPVEDAS